MKTVLAFWVAMAFLFVSFGTLAQSTPAPATDAAKTKRDDFAKKEKFLEDASKSSASGTVASPTGRESSKINKNNDAGKGDMQSMYMLQNHKPSPPVDKNAKATDPMKSISKMTPEERAQLREEVVKGAKP